MPKDPEFTESFGKYFIILFLNDCGSFHIIFLNIDSNPSTSVVFLQKRGCL